MKKKKLIISIIFSVLIFVCTFYIIFSKHSIWEIIDSLRILNNGCITISLLLMVAYFCIYGLYIKIIYNSMNEDCSIHKGIFYGFTEFLFNALTPGASGGQPITIYYMNKDGKPINKSTIVLLLSTVLFKLTLIVGGGLIFIFRPEYIFESSNIIRYCFYAGIIMDIFVAVFYLLVMYCPKLMGVILTLAFKFANLFLKNKINYKSKVKDIISNFANQARFVKDHMLAVVIAVILVFALRLCLFSIVYFIYRGLGFNTLSYFDLVLLQIFIIIAVEPIFLPGGTGISEFVSSRTFAIMFGSLSTSAMLLYRSLSFYIPLFVILILFIVISNIRKKNNK